MPSLTLHIKTTEGGIIRDPSILLEYTLPQNFHLIKKMIRHRKIDKEELATRACSMEEIKECSHPHRAGFIVYRNWDLLIKDEKNFTEDPEWFAKLEELKKQYPQFNLRKEVGNDH